MTSSAPPLLNQDQVIALIQATALDLAESIEKIVQSRESEVGFGLVAVLAVDQLLGGATSLQVVKAEKTRLVLRLGDAEVRSAVTRARHVALQRATYGQPLAALVWGALGSLLDIEDMRRSSERAGASLAANVATMIGGAIAFRVDELITAYAGSDSSELRRLGLDVAGIIDPDVPRLPVQSWWKRTLSGLLSKRRTEGRDHS